MKSNGKRNLRLIAVSAGVTTPLWILSGANVPTAAAEPATMSAILMGGALLLKRRRRKGDEKS